MHDVPINLPFLVRHRCRGLAERLTKPSCSRGTLDSCGNRWSRRLPSRNRAELRILRRLSTDWESILGPTFISRPTSTVATQRRKTSAPYAGSRFLSYVERELKGHLMNAALTLPPLMMVKGLKILPNDLLIFLSFSSRTIPWVMRVLYGATGGVLGGATATAVRS